MKKRQNIVSLSGLVVAAGLLGACDGEIEIPCKDEIFVNVVGTGEIEIEDKSVQLADIGTRLEGLSQSCGARVIVVVGTEDRAYNDTVAQVFSVVGKDPNVAGVGVASERFLYKRATKKVEAKAAESMKVETAQ